MEKTNSGGKAKRELQIIRDMERREQEKRRGIVRKGRYVWIPTLHCSSGARFGYWTKIYDEEKNW